MPNALKYVKRVPDFTAALKLRGGSTVTVRVSGDAFFIVGDDSGSYNGEPGYERLTLDVGNNRVVQGVLSGRSTAQDFPSRAASFYLAVATALVKSGGHKLTKGFKLP